ncbi:MAG TPA: hypothetical protein VGD66_10475 [Allosphingosinicella sp.]|jgi:hypothetical protein
MPEAASIDHPACFEQIAVVWSMPEASVLLATLSAYGIVALPRNQRHISVEPTLMIALGGIWIMVPREQLDDALTLMSEIDKGWRRPPPLFVRIEWLNAVLTLLAALFLVVTPMPRARGIYRWPERRLSVARPPAPAA